jgi:hypothetical protein
MVEGTGLKKKSSQWHDLPAELYENLLVSSKVISGRHTHKQIDRKLTLWSHKPQFPF